MSLSQVVESAADAGADAPLDLRQSGSHEEPINHRVDEIVAAVVFWGIHGHGGVSGLAITREASVLVAVLGSMNYFRKSSVLLSPSSEEASLVGQALGGAGQAKS